MRERPIDKTKCSALVTYDAGWHFYQCSKKPIVERDGKLYCKIHDPEYIKKKDKEREKKYDIESCKKCKYHFDHPYYSYCPLCGTKRER